VFRKLAESYSLAYRRGRGWEISNQFGRYANSEWGPITFDAACEWLRAQPKAEPKPKKAKAAKPKADRTDRQLARLAEERARERATPEQIAAALGFPGWGGTHHYDWFRDGAASWDDVLAAPDDPDFRVSELSFEFVHAALTLIAGQAAKLRAIVGDRSLSLQRRYHAGAELDSVLGVKDKILKELWWGVGDLDDIDTSAFIIDYSAKW
jgi:hypothetical protein